MAKFFLASAVLFCLSIGYVCVALRQDNRNRDLITAITIKNTSQVKRLLEAGADANAKAVPAEDMRHLSYWLRWLRRASSSHLACALEVALNMAAQESVTTDVHPEFGPDIRDRSIARLLVEYGADVNMTDGYGNSALMLAAFYDPGAKITSLLLDRGADVNHQGPGGSTPLVQAAFHAPPEVITLLLDRGARVNSRQSVLAALLEREKFGTPQSQIDANIDLYLLMLRLLRMGADVNAPCAGGCTLLHFAAEVQDSRYLRLMLAQELNVNAADSSGRTPLMLASYHATETNFDLLLAAGADIKARDKNGQTALNYAFMYDNHNDNQNIIQKLRRLGTKAY